MTKHLILGAAILLACVLPSPAQGVPAVDVTIDGEMYEVTTDTTTFNDSGTLLESQAWWGNIPLAEAFTTAVGTALGLSSQYGDYIGPMFSYQTDSSDVYSYASYNGGTAPISFNTGGIGAFPFTFAVATPIPESPMNPGLMAAAGLFIGWWSWRTVRPARA